MVLFGEKRWISKPFSDDKYMYSYEYFYSICRKNEIDVYRASYDWYDYKNKIFKYAWIFDTKNKKWKRAYNIKPDLVYDKTKSIPEAFMKISRIRADYPFFNCMEFSKIVDDKFVISMLFPEWCKKNKLIRDAKDLSRAFEKMPANKKLVLKPVNLSGGENVFIGTKKEIMAGIKKAKIKVADWMLQDFIDSSNGIPGVMRGVHDLRLVLIDEKISYSYYRKPASGSLLANLAQGGSMEIVPINKLPQNLFPIIKKANMLFSGFEHKIYALDVMFDREQRPWIVELNSMPGMYFAKGQEDIRNRFYGDLVCVFKSLLGKN